MIYNILYLGPRPPFYSSDQSLHYPSLNRISNWQNRVPLYLLESKCKLTYCYLEKRWMNNREIISRIICIY